MKFNVKEIIHSLPVILTIIFSIIGMITWLVTLNSKVGAIEKDHDLFGEFYQRQIEEIKNSQLSTEAKLDRLIERFISR